MASGAVFITFWMKTLTPLRMVGIASSILFFSYGLNADLSSITLLHGCMVAWLLVSPRLLALKSSAEFKATNS
jgi:hypothetical protein